MAHCPNASFWVLSLAGAANTKLQSLNYRMYIMTLPQRIKYRLCTGTVGRWATHKVRFALGDPRTCCLGADDDLANRRPRRCRMHPGRCAGAPQYHAAAAAASGSGGGEERIGGVGLGAEVVGVVKRRDGGGRRAGAGALGGCGLSRKGSILLSGPPLHGVVERAHAAALDAPPR